MARTFKDQPKVRSEVAQQAFLRGGAGSMGGSKRVKNRRDRQATRQSLRRGDW